MSLKNSPTHQINEGSGSFPTPHPEDPDPERSEGEGDEGSLKILQPFGLQDEPSGKNKKKNSPRAQINKSLKFSFLDGTFASAMVGFTQEYFTPFLLLLGGSVKQVGILNAFPNLLASLMQAKSADLADKLCLTSFGI